jgi:ABC-type sulfate transport system permease subunit
MECYAAFGSVTEVITQSKKIKYGQNFYRKCTIPSIRSALAASTLLMNARILKHTMTIISKNVTQHAPMMADKTQ